MGGVDGFEGGVFLACVTRGRGGARATLALSAPSSHPLSRHTPRSALSTCQWGGRGRGDGQGRGRTREGREGADARGQRGGAVLAVRGASAHLALASAAALSPLWPTRLTVPSPHPHTHPQAAPHPPTTMHPSDFFSEAGDAARYTVQEVIGKGSYGVVCSAIDNTTGERVAIKKINNVFDHVSDATRILREVKLLRLLRHPDIVDVKHIMLPPPRATSRTSTSCSS